MLHFIVTLLSGKTRWIHCLVPHSFFNTPSVGFWSHLSTQTVLIKVTTFAFIQSRGLGLSPHFIQLSRTWHSWSLRPPSNTLFTSCSGTSFLTGSPSLLCWLLSSFLTSKCWDPPHSVLSPCVFCVPKWSLSTSASLALNFSLTSRHEYQLSAHHPSPAV